MAASATDGTLDQFADNANQGVDVDRRDRSDRRNTVDSVVWTYWGASGVLQPLSEEFLYRSPADTSRRRVSRLLGRIAGGRHARG